MNYYWQTFLDKVDPRFWAVLVSLTLSLILGYNFYINADGILYLNTATSFLTHSAVMPPAAARQSFYPWLIAQLSGVAGITVQTSALILQALFLALLVVSFINIIRVLGGSRVIQHLAALTILLHPDLNENRHMIIRDFGYWAFFLSSLYYLLHYLDNPSWLNAGLWLACIGIATFFRIEGIVIALLSPLLIFFLPNQSLWRKFLHISRFYLLGLSIIGGGLTYLFWQHNIIPITTLGRIADLPTWWSHITGAFLLQWEDTRDSIKLLFPTMKLSHVDTFLIGGLITYVFFRLINTIGIFFLTMVIYGQAKQLLKKWVPLSKRQLLYGFLSINLFIIMVFVTEHWFVASRYLIPISLVLFFWIPFTLYFIYTRWQKAILHRRFPWLGKSLAGVIFLALFIECYISFGPSHAFVKQSAQWIQTHVPENSTLYVNNVQLAYYSNRPGIDWYAKKVLTPMSEAIANQVWNNYDYAAFYVNRNDKKLKRAVPTFFPYPPVAQFNNRHGDIIFIYQVKKS